MTEIMIKKWMRSIFTIGVVLLIVCSLWIGVFFSSTEKQIFDANLTGGETKSFAVEFTNTDIHYYMLSIHDFSKQSVLVKVINTYGNTIHFKKIINKWTVNYFQIFQTGRYALQITNLTNTPMNLTVEIGNSASSMLIIPEYIAMTSWSLIIVFLYKRLRDYWIAHPAENIS